MRLRVAFVAFALLYARIHFARIRVCALPFPFGLLSPLLAYTQSPLEPVLMPLSVASSARSPASTLVNTPRGSSRPSSPPGSPLPQLPRRAPLLVTPPCCQRDNARLAPLRPVRPFAVPNLLPFARDARPAPRAPSPPRALSPARAPQGNFILPSDVDANGDLLATVTAFPAQALRIMQGRWLQHLPLDSLTPGALRDAARRPHSDVTFAQSTADGRIAFVARELDERSELLLTESKWRQAYSPFLRLVHYHLARPQKDRIVRGLQEHFDWMVSQPDFYSDFVLYLRYDIAIRKLVATMENYIPKALEANIFTDLERHYLRDIARGVISTNNEPPIRPRSRSPSPRCNARPSSSRQSFYGPSRSPPRGYGSRPKGFDSRGQSFRQSSSVTFCIVCGNSGHSASACTTTRSPYLVLDKQTNRWLAPNGGQFCYRWNNNAHACKSCQRDHRCTLCGDSSHNARACSRANA